MTNSIIFNWNSYINLSPYKNAVTNVFDGQSVDILTAIAFVDPAPWHPPYDHLLQMQRGQRCGT